jgi:hypothetical protein
MIGSGVMLPHFIQEMMSHLGCNLTCTLKNYKVSEMLPFTVNEEDLLFDTQEWHR